MASYESSTYPGFEDSRTRADRLRRAVFVLGSVAFILGGFVFGFIFVARVESALGIAGQRILGVSLPTQFKSAVTGVPSAAKSLIPQFDFIPPSLGGIPTSPPAIEWSGKERINVLLLGVDTRPDERGQPTRTDTIMIASVDPVNKTGALLSIPRDLWVPIPLDPRRPLEDKITTAHFYGDYFQFPGGGPTLARKTIEYNLGIRIHYFAKIDFDGFENVVDTVGGVNVCVGRPLIDNEYPTRDYGYMRVFIPAGLQQLDGERALQYARSRHQDSDFGRIQRQQQVMHAIRDKAIRLDIIPKLPQLAQQFSDSIETDMSIPDMVLLARLASQIDRESIQNRAIEGDAIRPFITSGGADALLPVRPEIQKLVKTLFYDPASPPASVTAPAGQPEAEAAEPAPSKTSPAAPVTSPASKPSGTC